MTTCEICEREGETDNHPCRFEVCCACWRGVPCKGTGKVNTERQHMIDLGIF